MFRSLSMCAVGVAMLFANFSVAARAEGPESVQQLVGAPGHTVWQITRPRVNAAVTDYDQIVFAAGETVTVTASGCVQTGGKGLSWKRYVDPVGDKSATLYHGEIQIPGAMPGLQFFQAAQPAVYVIPAGVVLSWNHLRLGYTDTDYSDNGYSKFDNGDLNQCQGLGDAVVLIDIAQTQTVGAAPATASYVFTLQNVTIDHLRSQHNDTDVLGASVIIDGTQSNIATQSLGKLKEGSYPVNFPVIVDSVTPTDRIAISYVVANEGHPSTAQTDAILAGAVGKTGLTGSNGGSAVAAIAGFWTIGYDILNPDCDGPVAAGLITATGAQLYSETAQGPYQRTISFPGSKSAVGCGPDSLYQLTYSIAPVSAQAPPQIYAVKINVASKALQTGSNIRVIPKQ